MQCPTYEQVASRIRRLGFEVFDSKPYDLTLFGIRARRRTQGIVDGEHDWDDLIGVLFRDDVGEPVIIAAEATTDPGSHYLQDPLNDAGTAILLADFQHRQIWKLGQHRGQYEALVNRVNPVAYVRDDDRDSVLDVDTLEAVQYGVIGANMHRASSKGLARQIGRYSAGCQVIRAPWDYERMMAIVRLQPIWRRGSTYSYCLLNEWR